MDKICVFQLVMWNLYYIAVHACYIVKFLIQWGQVVIFFRVGGFRSRDEEKLLIQEAVLALLKGGA